MKKILLAIIVLGTLSAVSSCQKCSTCTGADVATLNHDYCNGIYRSAKALEKGKADCLDNGGVWSEK